MPSGTFSDIKNLHVKGHISIARDKNQLRKEFLTCGTDGTIYLWNEKCFNANETPEVVNIGESTNSCIVWKGENVYLGCTTTDFLLGNEKKIIGKASINDLGSVSCALNFGLEPTAVDVGEKFLVAGSSDFTVKIAKIGKEETYERLSLEGEILSIAISPDEKYCAFSVTNGSVSIYDLTEDVPKNVFSEKMFPGISLIDIENPRTILAWSSSGHELYVPSTGVIKIVDPISWTVSNKMFRGKGVEVDVFSTLCISPCGSYLASSTITNHCFIWRTSDREIVSQNHYKRISQGKNIITSLAFSPTEGRSLIVADANEGLSLWKNALPAGLGEIPTVAPGPVNDASMDDDDDDEEDAPIKRRNKLILDEADDDMDAGQDDEDTRLSNDIGAIKKKYGFTEETTGRLEDFGFGPISPGHQSREGTNEMKSYEPTTITKIVEYEPAVIPTQFVSGSTPSHHVRRYLKWNRYGVVRSFTEEENNSLEIEFHDASVHSEIIIDNSASNYCLADLCDKAIVLASSPDEKNGQSEILVIHISSWDPESRRWNTKLPVRDIAVDVLASSEIICVVTSQRNIRVFTLGGTQRHVICHPAPILTCALFGNKLSIASVNGGEFYEEYHGSRKSKAHYQYSVSSYNMSVRGWSGLENSVNTQNLPVCPGKRPLWLAYSSTGQLITMDNDYIVRLKSPAGFWVPIFDGAKEIQDKSDGIWPIAVVEGNTRQFRYLYCKGTRHPSLTTKQVPLISEWHLPYCQPESEKSKLEETLFLNELQQNVANDIGTSLSELNSSYLQNLVKLFALACKSERETRASELASFVSSSKGIQVMCNYASTLKKSALAEKVAAIGRENLTDSQPMERKAPITIAPRRVSMKRRTIEPAPSRISEVISQAESVDVFEERDEEPNENASQMNESLFSESIPIPLTPFNRNPFKRAADSALDTSTQSVFEQLESSFDNTKKRSREEATQSSPFPSNKRQKKLSDWKV